VVADVNLVARVVDFARLTKPGLTSLAVAAAFVGYWMGVDGGLQPSVLVGTLIGAVLIGAGANTLNQFLERQRDALMTRTANRPLPAGRLTPAEAHCFGFLLAWCGVAFLLPYAGWLSAAMGLATLLSYLYVYTPLKAISPWSTIVGAVPGALPVLVGWTAATGTIGSTGLCLFAIVFVWQIPHFMAIGWYYREDYRRAGYPIWPVVDARGIKTGLQAVIFSLILIPVSLLPTMVGAAGSAYLVGALASGFFMVAVAVAMTVTRSASSARRLFWTSIVYLPIIMALMMLDKQG
ncbi:MAG: protoheme IX farnesyltransferase, partial [Planctomycetes bacterium]|nr:protoheme IX farnesyltransferase [Planctomycetota bacterium]